MFETKNIYLNDREKLILKATVEDFIARMNPIGSNFLKQKHHFRFSPATIRNTLSELENKGLLTHPYTSSGRIPTDLGYRYYVDELMPERPSMVETYRNLIRELSHIAGNVDELMQALAVMLATVSHLFGAVMVLQYQKSILTDIELIPVSSERVMMILAVKTGFIRSIVLNLSVQIDQEDLQVVQSILKERLLGLSLTQIQATLSERLRDTGIYRHEIVQILLSDPVHHFSITSDKLLYMSPMTPLLDYPEFQEVTVLQKTMLALDSHAMVDYIVKRIGDKPVSITIGEENQITQLTHCSLISTRFNLADLMGQMVIVGPTRLPYRQVLDILENVSEVLPDVV